MITTLILMGDAASHPFLMALVVESETKQVLIMKTFNVKLAPFIEKEFLERVARERAKPQSLRAIARKLNLSMYAVKRLIEYQQLCKN